MPREIHVDPEFSALIAPLQAEERAQLEENLRRDGCLEPLIVWSANGKDILLDGHNRLDICRRLGIPFQTKAIEIQSREHARLWIEEAQAGRRNISDDQKSIIWDSIRAQRSALTQAQKLQKARDAKAGKVSMEDTLSSIEPRPRTRSAVAKESKLPERKLRAAQEVKKHAPALAQKVRSGEVSLAAAQREVRRKLLIDKLESIESRKPKELAGTYDVIVLDPPWPLDKIQRDVRSWDVGLAYPTMTLEDISSKLRAALKRHAEPNCHVFLWAPMGFLSVAIELLKNCGLNHSFTMVWKKPGGFQPFSLPQFNCEFIVYGRKGSAQFISTRQFPTCFEAPRGAHSEKPEEFYALLRRVTGGRRLDMFNRRPIEGFEGWGNESRAS